MGFAKRETHPTSRLIRLRLLLTPAFVNAIVSNGQYTWLAVWLPELFPTRMRDGACLRLQRAALHRFPGPFLAGTMIVAFGGYGQAAVVLCSIYILGLVVAPFLPETKGRPLPG
jgi:hypothetical protein